MKNLEIISKREVFTAKENVNGRAVFYQYETDNNNQTPVAVNFSTQGQDGKMLNGSYSQGGGFVLNGQGITEPSDLQIVQKAFATILEIAKPKTSEE